MSKSKSSSSPDKPDSNIHNDFFYDVFKIIAYLLTLMRIACPKALYEIVDWSTLELATPVISADEFNIKRSDLEYRVKLKDSHRMASIILMFEHKSFKDKGLVKQLAQYQFLRYLDDDFTSLIIPIVVRHAASDKRTSIEFRDHFTSISSEHLDVLSEYAVNFKSVLIDLLELDRQRQVKETNIDAVVRAMTIVRDYDASDWQELMERIKFVPEQDRQRMVKLLLKYIYSYNKGIKLPELLSLETRTPEEKQMVMSAIDELREEGREEGREEVAAKLLLKGMKSDEIVELTRLNRKQVDSLRKRINGSSGQ